MATEVKNTEKKMKKAKAKAKVKEEPKICPVCMDHFTPMIRQPIQCAFCPHATCRQCCSRFLLTTLNDPHCMECKREWNREFIDLNLTQTFRKGPLRQHRRKVLIDREKGRLPAMQSFVEAQKTMEECQQRIHEIVRTRKRLKRQRAEIQVEHGRTDTIQQLEERLRPIHIQLAELKSERRARENAMWTARAILTGQTRPEVRQFIMKCPGEECRGFLSSAWKCGTCQKFFCSDCHAEKKSQQDEEHACNEDSKATASLIRQETRPCPKCGIRISKIEGCFGKDTPVLLWDGTTKMSQDICVGDILIGDDGEPRTVMELVHGEDMLYEVTQKKGMTYLTNSKHKLALKLSGDRKLSWMESTQAWNLKWLDTEQQKRKTKKIYISDLKTKEEAYNEALSLKNTLPEDDVMEVTVDDYMKLPPSLKKELMGFKSTSCVSWEKQDVILDPYIMGLYIGDGINDGLSFAVHAEKDPEILEALQIWASKNDCSIKKDDTYRYRIARNNLSIPLNPLKKALDEYNLTRSIKSIPKAYLINDKHIRLQLLAGIIDTDGFVSENGKRVSISQSNHALGHQIAYLGRSLGFNVWIDFVKKENICWSTEPEPKCYPDHIRICMSGENLSEIPTRLPRKKCVNSTPNKDWSRSSLQIKEVGKGDYFGWSVAGNNRRFLLNDFTVVRNCDQMWCISCHTTFSWNTGQVLLNTVVHNPHYYEYLRSRNNGIVPREAGDVPCGGLPQAYWFTRLVVETPTLTQAERIEISDCLRCLSDIQYVRLPNYPLRPNANVNQDVDIQYLLNQLTEEEWGAALERTETNGERKKEIGLILQTLLHVGSEKYTAVQNNTNRGDRVKLLKDLIVDMRQVLEYTNKSLWQKGIQMGIVIPQITSAWRWTIARKGSMRKKIRQLATETVAEGPGGNQVVMPAQTTVGTGTESAPTNILYSDYERMRQLGNDTQRTVEAPNPTVTEEDIEGEGETTPPNPETGSPLSQAYSEASDEILVDLGEGEPIRMRYAQARALFQ